MSEYVIAPKEKITAIADKVRENNETLTLNDIVEKVGNGATSLNFTILISNNTANIKDPQENTICILDGSISTTVWEPPCWKITSTNPTSSSDDIEDEVCLIAQIVGSESSSTATFNILQGDNSIILKLNGAHLKYSGGWAMIGAYIYKNGSWINFSQPTSSES